MNPTSIGLTLQNPPCPETPWYTFVLLNIVLPIVIALATYWAVNWLGEAQKRRTYSKLGVAVIESLQEEIGTGIRTMTNALNAVKDRDATEPPTDELPNKSWSGMSTISDDVLLRIIETSANRKFDGFPLRECRIHCKNYFDHMCQNYNEMIRESFALAHKGLDWRRRIREQLAGDTGHYIEAATKVNEMLEHAKQLLEPNSRAARPK